MQENQNLERISHRYDAYIKKALKNYRTSYIRKNRDKWENEFLLDDLSFSKRENLARFEDRASHESIYLVDGRFFTEEMVKRAVDLLPEKKSVVITLRYYDEMSDSEIAETLGISRKGVNKRRKEALILLKELLEGLADGKEE